jgi:hypothetical protein
MFRTKKLDSPWLAAGKGLEAMNQERLFGGEEFFVL